MVEVSEILEAWEGTISSKRPDYAEISLMMFLSESKAGGSGAFLGRATDGFRYYLKPLNNQQGPKVPINEQIVGRMGALIGAPVCEVKTVSIPEAFTGQPYCRSKALIPGIAHGSRLIANSFESTDLEYRSEDDNRTRHAYIIALYDWCWGGDRQWLLDLADDYRYYSHDHGFYLSPDFPWTREDLLESIGQAHELDERIAGISIGAVVEAAEALRSIEREDIRDVLTKIPVSWPVSDEELEAVGCFLEYRAPQVADRLEKRFGI